MKKTEKMKEKKIKENNFSYSRNYNDCRNRKTTIKKLSGAIKVQITESVRVYPMYILCTITFDLSIVFFPLF